MRAMAVLVSGFLAAVAAWLWWSAAPQPAQQSTELEVSRPAFPFAAFATGGQSGSASRSFATTVLNHRLTSGSGRYIRPIRPKAPLRLVSSRRQRTSRERTQPSDSERSPAPPPQAQFPTGQPVDEQVELVRSLLNSGEKVPGESTRPDPPDQHQRPEPGPQTPAAILGEDPAELILQLTDQFRNSVLRGTVFDPQGDPQKLEELKREVVAVVRKLQQEQSPGAPAAPEPVALPQPASVAPGPAAPQVLEATVAAKQALRQAAQALSQVAQVLESQEHYPVADVLWETAHQLRLRARELTPPGQ